jgi:type I site-specific restriction endonuclease
VLSNAMLLTEGYDDPGIDCVVVLRPTRSRSLYSQMVGRGTRIAPFKENLLLLDLLWLHQRHNLIRPAHLVAKSDTEAEVITKIAQDKSAGGAGQMDLELEGLATEAAHQRHEALRKQLDSARKKKSKLVDAMEWCMAMGQPDLADYEPVMKWEAAPLSEKQAKLLKRAGVDIKTVTGKGHASKLIDLYMKSQKLTLATEGQRRVMRKLGHPNADGATADEARQFFATLKKKAA